VAEFWGLSLPSPKPSHKLEYHFPTSTMPTNDDGTGASPTATDVNASQIDVTALTPEQLEAHPHVQDLKKKYSAAHQDMDKTNLSKKELQSEIARLKVLAGEEVQAEEIKADEPQYVTKAELQEQAWELQNAKDVDLYGDDEYKNDLVSGIPREYALKTAKLRFQSMPDNVRLQRQQVMASGTAVGARGLSDVDVTDADRRGMAEFGYSEETVRKHKQMKRERGQI